jgi:hypothetical protein
MPGSSRVFRESEYAGRARHILSSEFGPGRGRSRGIPSLAPAGAMAAAGREGGSHTRAARSRGRPDGRNAHTVMYASRVAILRLTPCPPTDETGEETSAEHRDDRAGAVIPARPVMWPDGPPGARTIRAAARAECRARSRRACPRDRRTRPRPSGRRRSPRAHAAEVGVDLHRDFFAGVARESPWGRTRRRRGSERPPRRLGVGEPTMTARDSAQGGLDRDAAALVERITRDLLEQLQLQTEAALALLAVFSPAAHRSTTVASGAHAVGACAFAVACYALVAMLLS